MDASPGVPGGQSVRRSVRVPTAESPIGETLIIVVIPAKRSASRGRRAAAEMEVASEAAAPAPGSPFQAVRGDGDGVQTSAN